MANGKEVIKNIEVTKKSGTMKIDIGDNEIDAAIQWLTKKKQENDRVVSFHDEFKDCHPLDGLVAFHKALSDIYGWVDMVPTPGFFGSSPPKMVPVEVGFNKVIHVPFGRVGIPGLSGDLNTHISIGEGIPPSFIIYGDIKRKDIDKAKEIAEKTRFYLMSESIYRGKAIKVGFQWMRDEETFNMSHNSPKFLDLSGVRQHELVFSKAVGEQLNVGLWTLIEHTKSCQLHQVPLKRGVLLEGKYGTGKTLAALITAQKAVENGWTFVQLDSILDLPQALEFVKAYLPAVIFGEDVDRITGTDQRTVELDQLMNSLDGMNSKSSELITLLTTNNVKIINPGMMRWGRIDTVVSVSPPDAEAAVELVKIYGRDLLRKDEDLTEVGNALNGKIPAMIREVVERAKLATISRLNGGTLAGEVTANDLLYAAKALESHAALVNRQKAKKPKHAELHIWSSNDKHDGMIGSSQQELAQYVPAMNGSDEEEAQAD